MDPYRTANIVVPAQTGRLAALLARIRRFFQRRALRALTDGFLARWEYDGVFARQGTYSCHLCEERVIELKRRYQKRALSGETFAFSVHLAFVCRRCQTVSSAGDCSVCPVHVSEWVPRAQG